MGNGSYWSLESVFGWLVPWSRQVAFTSTVLVVLLSDEAAYMLIPEREVC
jgi:hypothetical protein